MNEAVMKFRQELNDSVELQEKLKSDNSKEAFIKLAKENGYEFTYEECETTYTSIKDSDEGLTDFEMSSASGAGGGCWWCLWFCWVAREVYGADNPQWLLFREWMLSDSPSWFRNLYISKGEAFAKWLSRHTWLKSMIRHWMDSRIRS
jgi:predicted ribosomally synthesized peptide with nif11-like leader